MLSNIWNKLKPALISIGLGLFVGLIIMLIINPGKAFSGMFYLLFGVFMIGNFTQNFGDILFNATPLLIVGLAMVIAFRSGLFNIGGSGQMVVGAFVAVLIGIKWDIPAPWHWMVAIIFGTIAGALWGMIPGLLKAFRNTNEVVSSIMMNYIGMYLVASQVFMQGIYDPNSGQSLPVNQSAWLPRFEALFGNSHVNIGFLIAIAMVVFIQILVYNTRLGFELQASGLNKDASLYAGMDSKKNTIITMLISGGLAGLAGSMLFLSNYINSVNIIVYNRLPSESILLSQGFDGISVALLAVNEPIGAVLSSLFLSIIRRGATYMSLPQAGGYVSQISEIIIAIIVYTIGISAGIQIFGKKYLIKIKQKLSDLKAKKEVNKSND